MKMRPMLKAAGLFDRMRSQMRRTFAPCWTGLFPVLPTLLPLCAVGRREGETVMRDEVRGVRFMMASYEPERVDRTKVGCCMKKLRRVINVPLRFLIHLNPFGVEWRACKMCGFQKQLAHVLFVLCLGLPTTPVSADLPPGLHVIPADRVTLNSDVSFNPNIGKYLVVWEEQIEQNFRAIHGRILNANGSYATSSFWIATGNNQTHLHPRVAYANGQEWVVVWISSSVSSINGNPMSPHYVQARTVSQSGVRGTVRTVAFTSLYSLSNPTIAGCSELNEYLVVWQQENLASKEEIRARRYLPSSGVTGNEMTVGNSTLHNRIEPAVNRRGRNYLVSWVLRRSNGDANIEGRYITRTGGQGSVFRICSNTKMKANPKVAAQPNADNFLVTWQENWSSEDRDIVYAMTDTYRVTRSPANIAGSTADELHPGADAIDVNGFLVSYHMASGLYVRRVTNAGVTDGSAVLVHSLGQRGEVSGFGANLGKAVVTFDLGNNTAIYAWDYPPNNPPHTPTLSSPANGATGMSLTPTLQASAFSDPNAGDTHANSQWQVSTSSAFTSFAWDSTESYAASTSATVPSGRLSNSTTYHWRVRYKDNRDAWSAWSASRSFTTLSGGPANDNFSSAIVISGSSGQTTGSNVNATKESGEPNHAGITGGRSVWWRWTAPASGQVTISTFGSNFDTTLAVYTGTSVSNLTLVAQNDDAGGGNQSQVAFNAVNGTVYRIAVDGYSGVSGSIVLNWTLATATLTINPTSRNHDHNAASGQTIGVTANVSWNASRPSSDSWITITGGSTGSGNGTVTYSVSANPNPTSRSGTITVSGGGITRTFTVNQAAASATLTINPTSRNHDHNAASGQTIGVTANVSWNASRPSSDSWITITGGSSGSGNGTVTYSVSANPNTTSRNGTITVSGGGITRTFTVNQAAAPATIPLGTALDASGLTWTTGGSAGWFGQTTVTRDGVDAAQSGAITHNQESWMQTTVTGPGTISFWWKVGSESNFDWLEFNVGSTRMNRISGNVDWQQQSFSVPAGQQTLKWRYVKDGSASVAPDAGWVDQVSWQTASLEINPTSRNHIGFAHSLSLQIAATVEWTATPNQSWITINGANTGSGNGVVSYSVTRNDGPDRTGTITITGGGITRTFTITQDRLVTISGRMTGRLDPRDPLVPIPGITVVFSHNGGHTTTDANGMYSMLLYKGWTGTATPQIPSGAPPGYAWSPTSRQYQDVTQIISGQDYEAIQPSLTISPTGRNHDHNAASGQTIGVTANVSWTATRPSSDSWITITGGSSGSGNGTVTYSVTATPNTTSRSGMITVSGSGISRTFTVTQAGQPVPVITVTPASQAFGTVAVGSTADRTFTVQNTGGGTLSGNASVPAPFSIVSGGSYNLAASASQTVTVRYSPTAAGNHSQSVSFTGGGGATRPVTGNTPAVLSVTPASQDFGSIQVGTTADRNFTVQNTGGGTLTGSASVPAPYTIASGANYSLGAGASQTVTVRYSPAAAGSHDQNVSFTGGSGATRPVTGSAFVPPAISVTPASQDFGTVAVGSTADRIFTVQNTGGGTLSGNASVPAPFSIVSGGSYNLAASASQTVTVRYSPTAAGNYSQNVTFTGGGGATRPVTGNTPAVLSVTPASQDFGSIQVGTTADRNFTVQNTGGGTLSGNASVSAPFSIVSGANYSLGAGASQTVTVRYSPAAAGSHSQNVTFTGGGGATRPVTGNTGAGAEIRVTPASLDFGEVPVGSSATGTFTVQNIGGGNLAGNASVSAGPFTIVSGGSYNLAAGASQSVTVRYSPPSGGTHNGVVTFTGGGGATRPVSGTAIAPPFLNVSPTSINFPCEGGTAQVTVNANVAWTVMASSWPQLPPGIGGSGQGTFSVTVPANPGSNEESGTITVSGGGITRIISVTQAACPVLEISPTSRDHDQNATSGQTISVTADVSWTATRPSSDSWITITGGASGSGSGTVTYSVAANSNTTSRSGSITVSGGGMTRTCTVNQAGTEPSLLLFDDFEQFDVGTFPSATGWKIKWGGANENRVVVPPVSQSGKAFHVRGVPGWSACVYNDSFEIPDIIEIEADFLSTGAECALFLASYHESTWGNRYAGIHTSADKVFAHIQGSEPLELGPFSAHVWYHIRLVYDRIERKMAVWMDGVYQGLLVGDRLGAGYRAIEFYSAHSGNSAYIDNLAVRVRTDFPGATSNLTISPANRDHTDAAANGQTISVTADVSWTATRSSSDSWITITDGASGSGSGTVTYSVAANSNTTNRSGSISVAGGGINRAFTVNQAGGIVERFSLQLSPSPWGGGTIQLTPQPGSDGRYAAGTEVTATAVPAQGYAFRSWQIGGMVLPAIIPHPNPIRVMMDQSRTGTAMFDPVPVAQPVFSPHGGTHVGENVQVTVTCATPGATIRCTTDGRDPSMTAGSTVASGTSVSVPLPGVLKARAFKDGMPPSATRTATYARAPLVAQPVFDPNGGEFDASTVTVTVRCGTEGATVRYTVDGRDPVESSPVIAQGGTVQVPVPGTLKARAWKHGMNPSAVASAVFKTNGRVAAMRTINGAEVSITVSPAAGVSAWGAEESLPVGLTPSNLTGPNAVWNPTTRKITWYAMSAVQATLGYTVGGAGGTHTVAGRVNFNAISAPISGPDKITLGNAHPADTNADWAMDITETITYLVGWQQGRNPMGYAIRAVYLWQHGEEYERIDGVDEPTCWVPVNLVLAQATRTSSSLGMMPASQTVGAVRTISGLAVNISVTPPAGTWAWGYEELIPAGLTPSGITGPNASWSATSRKITWMGFGEQVQSLGYTLTGEDGIYVLNGSVNFDGDPSEVTGDNEIMTRMPAPTFNPDGGYYQEASVEVTLGNRVADAVLRYTTDGSDPTAASPSVGVGGTVTVPVPGILKASAWKGGITTSTIAAAHYGACTENGIPLEWLAAHGLPTDGSADFDYRNDHRLSVWEAWRADVDPNNPADDLRLTGAPHWTAEGLLIRWSSVATRTYRVERSLDLTADDSFVPVASGVQGVAGAAEYTDQTATGIGSFFYRIVVE